MTRRLPNYRSRKARRTRAQVIRESVQNTGGFKQAERVRGRGEFRDGRPRTRSRAVIVGITGPQGGISALPGNTIAFAIRSALRRPPIPPVTIYDAQGHPVAMMDPLTLRRTPL